MGSCILFNPPSTEEDRGCGRLTEAPRGPRLQPSSKAGKGPLLPRGPQARWKDVGEKEGGLGFSVGHSIS